MFFLFVVASVLPSFLCQGPALYVEDALGHHNPVTGGHPSGPLTSPHAQLAGGQTPPYRSPAYVGSFGGQQHQPQHAEGHSQGHPGAPASYQGSHQPQHVSGDGEDSEHGPEPAHDNQDGYEQSSDDGKDGPRSSYGHSDGDGKDTYGGANEIGHDDYGYDGPQRSYGSGEDNGPHQSEGVGGSYHSSEGDGDHYGSRRPHHASGYEEHRPRSRGRRRHRNRHSHHEPSEHHGHSDHHEPSRVHGHDSSYHGAPIHGHHHRQPQLRHHHSQGHTASEGHSLHGGHPHRVQGHHGSRLLRGPSLHYRPSHGHGDMVVGRPVKLTDDSMYGLTLSPMVLSQRPYVLTDGLHHGYNPQVVDLTQAAPMAHYDLSPTLAGGWMAAASPFINAAHLKS